MVAVAEFVRGTLAYLSNCAVAVVTLLGSALRLRPVIGALRCRVREVRLGKDVPDGRVMLFLGCCALGLACTYYLNGITEVVRAMMRSAVGAGDLSKNALVTSAIFYFTCEWAIAKALPRKTSPGRRGLRNREILRFLVASLLMQITLYEPLASILLRHTSDLDWFHLTGNPNSTVGEIFDDMVMLIRIAVLLAPMFFLVIALDRAKSIRISGKAEVRSLATLPLGLLQALLLSSILMSLLYPAETPELVSLGCELQRGASSDQVAVDARFVNASESYWRPVSLRVDLLAPRAAQAGEEPVPSREDGGSSLWMAPRGDDDISPFPIPPRKEVRFRGHAWLGPHGLAGSKATSCTLVSDVVPRPDLLGTLLGSEQPALRWSEVIPAATMEGPAVLNTSRTPGNGI